MYWYASHVVTHYWQNTHGISTQLTQLDTGQQCMGTSNCNTLTQEKKTQHYFDYIISETSVIDEIALVMLAKMYDIHVTVLYRFDYWTTNNSKDLDECDITLAYRGKLQFSYTKKLEQVSLQTYIDNKNESECQIEINNQVVANGYVSLHNKWHKNNCKWKWGWCWPIWQIFLWNYCDLWHPKS